MSKHIFEINFEDLKFNLYELLAVSKDCSESKVKKAYRKLMIKFHPDKNNIIDEEIYYHLTIANQVLTSSILRKKYDDWLNDRDDNNQFNELKDNYKNSNDNLSSFENKDEAKL